MKTSTKLLTSLLTASVIVGGVATLTSNAEGTNNINSKGRFEADDIVFDYRDFTELESAIEVGKQETYDRAYSEGYAKGLANQPAINANVTYVFHHHDTGNGEPTEVSFTAEEVENGTKDAWFAAHPVPEKMSSAVGDYTKQNTHQEKYISSYKHHEDCVSGTGEWVRHDDPQYACGYTMEWTGQIRVWDEPVYSTRTVSDGFVPACGHDEGSCIRVIVDIN
jgi:hypothetical protein